MRLWILGDSAMRGDSSIAPLPNATLTSEYISYIQLVNYKLV